MKTLLAVLFLSALSFGSTTCQSTFYVASGSPGAFSFCVTENGNVAYLNTGLPQITDGAEGYALCGGENFWDLGLYGDSGNWQPSVITQPGGPGTFPLTITRTAADFTVSLVQQFSIGAGGKSIHVKMTVTGIDARIIRFAHAGTPQSHGDRTLHSSFILTPYAGLMASQSLTSSAAGGLIVASGAPADICSPQPVTTPYLGDSAMVLIWNLIAHRKNIVSFDYVPMR